MTRFIKEKDNDAKLKFNLDSLSEDLPQEKTLGGLVAQLLKRQIFGKLSILRLSPQTKGWGVYDLAQKHWKHRSSDIALASQVKITKGHRELREQRSSVNIETGSLRIQHKRRKANKKALLWHFFCAWVALNCLISLSPIRLFTFFSFSSPISSALLVQCKNES